MPTVTVCCMLCVYHDDNVHESWCVYVCMASLVLVLVWLVEDLIDC